jgi:hypothetical protein
MFAFGASVGLRFAGEMLWLVFGRQSITSAAR